LFCDLFASVAPTPDPRIVAMTTVELPPVSVIRNRRRRRRADHVDVPQAQSDDGLGGTQGSAAS
ncbi:MAG TPA: hypothetical protein VNM34_08695, partial [Verrucomicrobiae bacterium]|nr:hypothetical protein [Verrucomicrobiae bacterium]